MTSTRETVLESLATIVTAACATLQVPFARDPEKTVSAAHVGTVVMRDGDPGKPEIVLSPLMFLWEHDAEIDVIATGESRTTTVDGILTAIDAAVRANPTMSGTVDFAQIMEAPSIVEHDPDLGLADLTGGETERIATVMVRLYYASSSPAG